MNIDDRFVDYDFTRDPNYVAGDLGVRAFGATCRSYNDVVPTIAESEWPALIERMDAEGGGAERLVTRIYNQRNEGSCVANACAQAHEVVQALQFGKDKVVPLSAISLYKRIGRSPGSGAMVSDGLEEMASRGVLPLDTPENRQRFGDKVMPPTGFYTNYPTGWEATAKNFRVTEWFIIRSVGQLITALLHQHPVVVGRAGHSICYLRPTRSGGSLKVVYANSWSANWGFGAGDFTGGFGADSMNLISSSARWAFAVRSVVVPTL